YTKRSSAIYRGVLNLIGYAAQGLRDWRSAQRIDPSRPLDDHHIFPKAYVAAGSDLDVERVEALQMVDCVVNRTLIPKNLNLRVGKRPPHAYLGELKKSNSELEDSLIDHLVPPELSSDPGWDRKFGEFLDFRSRSIFALVERFVLEPAGEMEQRHLLTHGSREAAGTLQGQRLDQGLRTPEEAFVLPILEVLIGLGGRAPMHRVLDGVGQQMRDRFQEVDQQSLMSTPGQPRWRNTAQWARNTMVKKGLLSRSSPRGIWEVTETGRRHFEDQSGHTRR
ncbi:winged helix-turn-helix domain-containing protein, partial [Tautonia marina]|uniref:winged helix-turn-helix domain-containing protein n=1 Tax=Tautonia marina TaxID=2653855 RepID=UPI00191BDB69